MMKTTSSILPAVLVAALLSGCASVSRAPEAFYAAGSGPHRLDAGDRIRVTVFQQPDLSNTYTIDHSGRIAFPLVGAVKARGLTPRGMEAEIARKLRQGYLRHPDVSVEVVAYRAIFVTGQVGSSGQYVYAPGMTVEKAVAKAGGFLPKADRSGADISRRVGGKEIKGRVPLSGAVAPGDTLYIRQRLF